MKKYQIINGIILVAVMSGNVAIAAPANKEARSVEREAKIENLETNKTDKKAQRDEKIANKKAEIEEKKVSRICERVDKTREKVTQQQKERIQKGTERINTAIEQLQSKREQRQEQLQKRRTIRDAQRAEFYVKLEEQAKTEEQVTAVGKFKKTIEDAVQVRRKAIDNAIKETELENDVLIADKKAEIVKMYNEYEKNKNEIMSQVRVRCDETTTAQDLKGLTNNTNTQLNQLRVKFREQLSQSRKIGQESSELASGRNAEIQEAIAIFKETVDTARTELKLAFEEDLGANN